MERGGEGGAARLEDGGDLLGRDRDGAVGALVDLVVDRVDALGGAKVLAMGDWCRQFTKKRRVDLDVNNGLLWSYGDNGCQF